MPKIAVVYFTKTDVTGRLAEAISYGVQVIEGIDVILFRVEGQDIVEGRYVHQSIFEKLQGCDAIIFGSPTYMGGVSAQFKAFADATSDLWCEQVWGSKLAAGFTCGSAMNGDQSSTLQYLVTLASQHGMLWVSLDTANGYGEHQVNRLGCQLGVVAHSEDGQVHDEDLATARYLGERVARQVLRMLSQ